MKLIPAASAITGRLLVRGRDDPEPNPAFLLVDTKNNSNGAAHYKVFQNRGCIEAIYVGKISDAFSSIG